MPEDQITKSIPSQPSVLDVPKVPGPPLFSIKSKVVVIIGLLVALIVSIAANFLQFQGLLLNKGLLRLPIDPQNRSIKSYATTYYFETYIREIKGVSNDIELITDIKDPLIPKFIVSSETIVFVPADGTYKGVSSSQLKVGQKVGVLIRYVQNQKPYADRVTILP